MREKWRRRTVLCFTNHAAPRHSCWSKGSEKRIRDQAKSSSRCGSTYRHVYMNNVGLLLRITRATCVISCTAGAGTDGIEQRREASLSTRESSSREDATDNNNVLTIVWVLHPTKLGPNAGYVIMLSSSSNRLNSGRLPCDLTSARNNVDVSVSTTCETSLNLSVHEKRFAIGQQHFCFLFRQDHVTIPSGAYTFVNKFALPGCLVISTG
jgi:hypothetical protein